MMKNKKGITLVSLVVTILIMVILIGIGITAAYTSINDVKDNKLMTELGIVRQAIMEQYALAEAVNQTKIPKDSDNKVAFWIGEPKENAKSELDFLSIENPIYQEQIYYELAPVDLKKIGVNDAKDTYIVNYSTGEVYNETTKTTSDDTTLLYLPSTIYDISTQTEDTENFSDWSENQE